VADVVYGSRFFGRPHRSLMFHHYLGNRIISTLFDILYDQLLTDIEVCYKMFTREVLDSLRLSADDFGFEVQFSAQVALARRWRIYEIGISYYGRTFDEGKKINWRDGAIKALWYLTFSRRAGQNRRREYLRYLAVTTVGVLINFSVYAAVLYLQPWFEAYPVVPLAAGSLVAMTFNFAGVRWLAFDSGGDQAEPANA
jgi:hypothetical protein